MKKGDAIVDLDDPIVLRALLRRVVGFFDLGIYDTADQDWKNLRRESADAFRMPKGVDWEKVCRDHGVDSPEDVWPDGNPDG